jgi:hypothetical protein
MRNSLTDSRYSSEMHHEYMLRNAALRAELTGNLNYLIHDVEKSKRKLKLLCCCLLELSRPFFVEFKYNSLFKYLLTAFTKTKKILL